MVDWRCISRVFLNFVCREEMNDKSLPQRCIPEKIKKADSRFAERWLDTRNDTNTEAKMWTSTGN